MSEYEVEVEGGGPEGPLHRLGQRLKALAMRPTVVALGAAVLFVLLIGTPHVGWDYQCRHRVTPGDGCQDDVYCAYYGIQGRREVFPKGRESCHLVTLLPIDWGALFGAG
jgi:hypothetical protein